MGEMPLELWVDMALLALSVWFIKRAKLAAERSLWPDCVECSLFAIAIAIIVAGT